jgi:hypothetical protein
MEQTHRADESTAVRRGPRSDKPRPRRETTTAALDVTEHLPAPEALSERLRRKRSELAVGHPAPFPQSSGNLKFL